VEDDRGGERGFEKGVEEAMVDSDCCVGGVQSDELWMGVTFAARGLTRNGLTFVERYLFQVSGVCGRPLGIGGIYIGVVQS
jgi:hypothetical protein